MSLKKETINEIKRKNDEKLKEISEQILKFVAETSENLIEESIEENTTYLYVLDRVFKKCIKVKEFYLTDLIVSKKLELTQNQSFLEGTIATYDYFLTLINTELDLAGSEIRLTEDYMDDLSDKVKNKFELLDKIKELDTENKRLKDLIKEASENALELNKNDDIQCQETKT